MKQRELLILPFNTYLGPDQLEQVAMRAVVAFGGAYAAAGILPPMEIRPSNALEMFARNVETQRYDALKADLGKGLIRDFNVFAGGHDECVYHGLAITDMLLSYKGFRAGGFADKDYGVALATERDISLSDIREGTFIRRLAGVAVHELGHLYGLGHHDSEITPGLYCPMINRTWDDPEFRDERARGAFQDSRADAFCGSCYKAIEGEK
ncbi:MAG: hypothetical protein HY518_02775 [Candidatus Aenigmarchaeota archaeon]|nr:hypothetical protein [Candidatus Aenigmarchaeota archaeon]